MVGTRPGNPFQQPRNVQCPMSNPIVDFNSTVESNLVAAFKLKLDSWDPSSWIANQNNQSKRQCESIEPEVGDLVVEEKEHK